jgi:hypothetical protein
MILSTENKSHLRDTEREVQPHATHNNPTSSPNNAVLRAVDTEPNVALTLPIVDPAAEIRLQVSGRAIQPFPSAALRVERLQSRSISKER